MRASLCSKALRKVSRKEDIIAIFKAGSGAGHTTDATALDELTACI